MNYCSLAHDCAKLFVSFQLSTFFCSRVMDMHGAGELCVVSFWATACKTVRPTLSVRCLSCPVCLSVLSVTFVHCGQKVGRIKMKLGTQVGLGPGHIVLDGDPFSPPQGGGAKPPNYRPISVVAKWLNGSRCHLIWRKHLAQATLC